MSRERNRPELTRKHFEAISAAISKTPGGNLRRRLGSVLVPVLKEFNPGFNEDLFLTQCQGRFTNRATFRQGGLNNNPRPPAISNLI